MENGCSLKQLMTEANVGIETVSVQEALETFKEQDVVFIDIREQVERNHFRFVAPIPVDRPHRLGSHFAAGDTRVGTV